jgi:beta-N-acetylhexosaminidase
MTDSLAMGALPQGGTADAAVEALAAGADVLLVSANFDIPAAVLEDAYDRVLAAIRSGRIPRSRLDGAVARILAVKRAYPPLIG